MVILYQPKWDHAMLMLDQVVSAIVFVLIQNLSGAKTQILKAFQFWRNLLLMLGTLVLVILKKLALSMVNVQ